MANGNTVTIGGNLTRDPELANSQSGVSYVRFSIGRSYRTRNDQTKSDFFDFVAFNELAEHIANTLHKGDRVLIEATLSQSKWQAEVDGEQVNRSRVELRVEDIGPSLRWAEAVVEKAARPEKTEAPAEAELALVGGGDGEEPF